MSRRVVVTGMGAVTPIGLNVNDFFEGLKQGTVGIGPITRYDISDHKVKVAGQINDFQESGLVEPKKARRMSRFTQYAVAAANEAANQAKFKPEEEDMERVGVILGVAFGGVEEFEEGCLHAHNHEVNKVKPLLLPKLISNMAAATVAIEFGAHGKCMNIATACASGTNAIGEAYRHIANGEAEVMFAGGAESVINSTSVAGFTTMGAMTTVENPMRASIPFDQERSGFVMGEGAGVLLLEEYEHAKNRGANILAEVVGYGSNCDAHHMVAPMADGTYAIKAMKLALEDAKLNPEAVDYINAHGTSTKMNDAMEDHAIKEVFGSHAYHLHINSTKSMIGHTLGAAGGIESIVCIKSMLEGYIHQTAGLMETDDGMDLNYCQGAGVEKEVNVAMNNSFGFGGHNASLIFAKI